MLQLEVTKSIVAIFTKHKKEKKKHRVQRLCFFFFISIAQKVAPCLSGGLEVTHTAIYSISLRRLSPLCLKKKSGGA